MVARPAGEAEGERMTADRTSYRARRVASDHGLDDAKRPDLPADAPPDPATTWVGWLWDTRAREWVRACQAGAISECSRLLTAAAKAHGVRRNLEQVLTRGAAPVGPPPGRTGGHHRTPC
jgi:hypothetical protein